MTDVARELATHVVGVLQRYVLRGKLTILRVNALEQRLQLAIGFVLGGARKVNLAQRTHDVIGKLARHERRHHDDDHERHGERQRHASQEGRQRRTNLRQSQHRPIGEEDGRVEGVASQGGRAAQHRGLLLRFGGLHLFTVGMTAQTRGVLPVVVQHFTRRADERAAHVHKGDARKSLGHLGIVGFGIDEDRGGSGLGKQQVFCISLIHPETHGTHGQGHGQHHGKGHAEKHGEHACAQAGMLTRGRVAGRAGLSPIHSQPGPWRGIPRHAPSGCTPRLPDMPPTACGEASAHGRRPCASRPHRLSPTRARAVARG